MTKEGQWIQGEGICEICGGFHPTGACQSDGQEVKPDISAKATEHEDTQPDSKQELSDVEKERADLKDKLDNIFGKYGFYAPDEYTISETGDEETSLSLQYGCFAGRI